MMRIRTEPLPEITVSRLRRMRDVLDLDPPYQREGNVWKPETRSALIDSIVNGLDVPKLYFERVTTKRTGPKGLAFEYAAIDGKQRLEAILAFMDNKLALPDDFWFFENSDIDAAGLTLAELEGNEKYFELVRRFWDFELPIVVVDTDSGDLIEEMFQRLNASTALNAAERRNSVQGPTREAANRLAAHRLLVELSPIRSARYKYRELGAKFLAIEHQIDTRGKIADTKAATLYDLFVATRDPDPTIVQQEISAYEARAAATLDRMAQLFDENDPLLRSIGTVVVYYIAFRDQDFADAASRDALSDFETARRAAAAMAETHDTYSTVANARLREYNVWVQSTNDGTALARRAKILSRFVLGHQSGDAMAALETMTEGEVPKEDDSAD